MHRIAAFFHRIADLSSLLAALFARGRRTGQKNALRFEDGFSRRTGIARGFRDRIPGEGAEDERSGWEATQNGEVAEIMKWSYQYVADGARLQHGRFGGHLKNRGGEHDYSRWGLTDAPVSCNGAQGEHLGSGKHTRWTIRTQTRRP